MKIIAAILTVAPVLLAQAPPNAVGVMGAPYSAQAVTETIQTLADGNRIVNTTTSTLYRDSLGRERRELSPPTGASNGRPAQTVLITDPVAGARYTLDANSRIAHKMPAPASIQAINGTVMATNGTVTTRAGGGGGTSVAIAGGLLPPGAGPWVNRATGPAGANRPAPKVEQLGTTMIEGVLAEGTRTTTTIPAGQIGNDRDITTVFERWYSPDLKTIVLLKNSDPRMGETNYRVTQINRSEPDPSLFQVPADYTVIDPPAGNAVYIQKPQP